MTDFHVLRPGWLLALPPVLALLVWLWRKQVRSRSWEKVCDADLLPHLLLGRSRRRAAWPLWLLLGGALLSILALAGPAWRQQPQPLFRQQSALVILLDLSRSMSAGDLKPSRLERARLKVEDLLSLRSEGQTALIAFAGDAFTVTPLTDDTNTIRALLHSLDPNLMPVQGSEPQKAIELGLQLLQRAGLKQGRLLLITDEDRPDKALEAARGLPSQGIDLAVLGVGTTEGAPVPLPSGGFLKDNGGAMVLPKLEEAGLKQLAAAGGGSYRRLSIDEGDLRALLAGVDSQRIDRAEQAGGRTGQRWREEGVWLLWPLALLASLAFRRGWLVLFILIALQPRPVLAFSWNDLWQRPDQQAAAAFAEEDYEKAGHLFRDPRWKASAHYRGGDYQAAAEALQQPETADDWYNRGNALARAGQLPQALEAYRQALAGDPEHADARYNKDLVEKALQKQQQPQQNDGSPSEKPQASSRDSEKTGQPQDHPDDESRTADDDPARENPAEDRSRDSDASPESSRPPARASDARSDRETHPQQESVAPPDEPEKRPESPPAAPADEEQLSAEEQRAMQQWLQQIPDDPGGLLRRKFLHQYRQRGRQLETDRPW
ncbi:MAG: VWA domain-containing protein [Syntrophotaleaceae bacterium]